MANPNPQTNKYSYIPPSVQKTMDQAMARNMPQNLQRFQNTGTAMPRHIEKAMSQHMQKNLPKHMKQYADAYMHQNVVNQPRPQTQTVPGQLPSFVKPSRAKNSNRQNLIYMPKAKQQVMASMAEFQPAAAAGGGSGGRPQSEYDFILNPDQPKRPPLFNFSGESTLRKALILGGGFVILIILISVAFSFLNSAGSAHREKLIEIAQSQTEIARISTSAQEKISNRDLLYKSINVQYSVNSSSKEIIAAIGKRGGKADDKKLAAGQNPENDAALVKGEEDGKFDETYEALLKQQLENYKIQLQSAYDSANDEEKAILESAFEQIDLLLKTPSRKA